MAFDPTNIRLERFRTELYYHAAWNYLSLKGVLAERWAHGPLFGAVADQGNQVKLTPEEGFQEDRVEGMYGVRASYFDREFVQDEEKTHEQAKEWLRDVVEVLGPQVTTKIVVQHFALYPLSNQQAAESATKKLRLRYYTKDKIDGLLPAEYSTQFSAVNGFCVDGDRRWSLIMGVVGPPHKDQFFGVPDPDRDESWWMGLNFRLARESGKEGIAKGDPMPLVEETMAEAFEEYKRLVHQGLGSVLS